MDHAGPRLGFFMVPASQFVSPPIFVPFDCRKTDVSMVCCHSFQFTLATESNFYGNNYYAEWQDSGAYHLQKHHPPAADFS